MSLNSGHLLIVIVVLGLSLPIATINIVFPLLNDVIDDSEHLEQFYGFAIRGTDFYEIGISTSDQQGRYKRAYFAQLKQWGFTHVMPTIWWGTWENEDGSYRTDKFSALRKGIDLAKQEGIKFIIAIRVMYDPANPTWETSWSNGPSHDYANLDNAGRARFAKFVGYVAQWYPDCIIVPWQMPYHKQSCNVGSLAYTTYLTKTYPMLYQAVRKHNSQPIFFVPIHQGKTPPNNYYLISTPFGKEYENLIYGFGHMLDSRIDYAKEPDSTTYSDIDARWEGITKWKSKYGDSVKFVSVEFAPLQRDSSGGISQARLNCLAYTVELANKCHAGYMWWRISLNPNHHGSGHDNLLDDVGTFTPNPSLLNVLRPKG